jgi:hypothetical protein
MDNYVLYGPGGASPVNLGTWLQANPGPDFDPGAVLQPNLVAHPYSEGAVGFTQSRPRTFTFPLTVGSHSGWGGRRAGETLIRQLAVPNAFIDLQPEGTPSAEAVRFDVLAGRWLPHHDVFVNRAQRTEGTLELSVGPFGYWPTSIILASVASVALPGSIAIAAGAVIGDAPGQAILKALPSVPASVGIAGSWNPDLLAWSVAGRPSFLAVLSGASFAAAPAGAYLASVLTDTNGIDGRNWSRSFVNSAAPTFNYLVRYTISAALEPAYRGRFRAFMWARGAAQGYVWRFSVDVGEDSNPAALASAAQVATVSDDLTGTAFFRLVDLGELTIPPAASGMTQDCSLRVWSSNGTTVAPSGLVDIAGIYLQPLDGAAGVVPRGLSSPTSALSQPGAVAPHTARLQLDTTTGQYALVNPVTNTPDIDARAFHRGVPPMVGASTVQLDLLGAVKKISVASDAPAYNQGRPWAAVSLQYRPRFQFLKGL